MFIQKIELPKRTSVHVLAYAHFFIPRNLLAYTFTCMTASIVLPFIFHIIFDGWLLGSVQLEPIHRRHHFLKFSVVLLLHDATYLNHMCGETSKPECTPSVFVLFYAVPSPHLPT